MPRSMNVSAHLQQKTGNFAEIVTPSFHQSIHQVATSKTCKKPLYGNDGRQEDAILLREGVKVPVLGALGAMAIC